jgi:uncharacterized membrane protein
MKTQEAVLCSTQDFPDVEGMLFVRITDILNRMLKAPLIAISIILAALAPAQQSFGAVRALDFTVYPDGTTHISQESTADPQDPELTVSLFGSTVDNFVAQDENGVLLSFDIGKTKATIQTFGTTSVSIDYDTYDLVSKKGKIWTLVLDSPVDYTLNMPEETVIVGMTNFPELVETVDNRQRLSLPKGENQIDYFFGVSGPAQSALKAIDDAKDLITQANSDGVNTAPAQEKLDLAILEYDNKKYVDAEQLAFEAQQLARDEMDNTENPPPSPVNSFSWFSQNIVGIATSLAAIGGAISAITLILKKTRSAVKMTIEPLLNKTNGNSESEEIGADEVETPEMREDDKRLVVFLEQNGGQAFERDLRKKFLLPRTTMWRAVKRLERQGIIEIEKKEFQNLVRLKKGEDVQ